MVRNECETNMWNKNDAWELNIYSWTCTNYSTCDTCTLRAAREIIDLPGIDDSKDVCISCSTTGITLPTTTTTVVDDTTTTMMSDTLAVKTRAVDNMTNVVSHKLFISTTVRQAPTTTTTTFIPTTSSAECRDLKVRSTRDAWSMTLNLF